MIFQRRSYDGVNVIILTSNLNKGTALKKDIAYDKLRNSLNQGGTVSAPEIFIVGIQELIGSIQSFIFRKSTDTPREENEFTKKPVKCLLSMGMKLAENLFQDSKFCVAGIFRKFGIGTIALVRSDFFSSVNICGFGSYFDMLNVGSGFKGAVIMVIDIKASDSHVTPSEKMKFKICLINCHLYPHNGALFKWIRDNIISNVMKSVIYVKDFRGNKSKERVQDSNFIFIFGDLNYRLLCSSDKRDLVFDCVRRGDVYSLTCIDELILNMNTHEYLKKFREPDIKFLPTYKKNTYNSEDRKPKTLIGNYNTNNRVPAYCDRIIACSTNTSKFNSKARGGIKVQNYRYSTKASFTKEDIANLYESISESNSNRSGQCMTPQTSPPKRYKMKCRVYTAIPNSIVSDHDPVLAHYNISEA